MYQAVYNTQVVHDLLLAGYQVICFDKQDHVVLDLLKIPVDDYTTVLAAANADKTNRFLFYYWKEEEEE